MFGIGSLLIYRTFVLIIFWPSYGNQYTWGGMGVKMKNKAEINAVIKTTPHPEPQRLVDLWARIVLKEILRRERNEQEE
jgi:hypothetical protein